MEWKLFSQYKPKDGQYVLVFHYGIIEKKIYEYGIFYDGEIYCYCPIGEIKNVTHWMELPKGPERLNPEDGNTVCDSLNSYENMRGKFEEISPLVNMLSSDMRKSEDSLLESIK